MEAVERPRILRNVRRFGSWTIISPSIPFMEKYGNGRSEIKLWGEIGVA